MKGYSDLHDYTEDERIEIIGRTVLDKASSDKTFTAAICVEDDAKADRYIEKLKKKFPTIRIIERVKGDIATNCEIVSIRVGGPLQ